MRVLRGLRQILAEPVLPGQGLAVVDPGFVLAADLQVTTGGMANGSQ